MALNKCVIISEGPGGEGVLTDEAVIVPPENVECLAEAIERLWHDDKFRAGVAARGYDYAMSLGGYDRLLADVLRISLQSFTEANVSRQTNYAREAETSR